MSTPTWRTELDAMIARISNEDPPKLRLTPEQRRTLTKAIGEIADRITVLEQQIEADKIAKKAARNGHSTWKGII